MNLSAIATTVSRTYGLVSDDPFRLQSLDRNNGLSRTGGSLTPVSSSQVRLSDYGRLQSALSALKNTVRGYDSADKIAGYSAKSDQAAIGATIGRQIGAAKGLAVEVTQLAQSQRTQSQAFADEDTTTLGAGTLSIALGRYNSSTNVFSANTSRTVTVSAANSTLSGVASAINRADAGISARVVKDSTSQYRLELTGKASGAGQAFRITVADSDGSDSDNLQGLSRLAYDPASPVGAGQNQSLLRVARDAQLNVDGQPYTSSENKLDNVSPGVSLNFTATGSASIRIGRDADQAAQSAKALTAAFNRFRDQYDQLAGDGLTRKVGEALDRTLTSAETGSGQTRLTLAQIGISKDRDDKLVVDDKQFRQAFAKDAEGVSQLLASTAGKLDSTGSKLQSGPLRSVSDGLRSSAISEAGYPGGANQPSLQGLFGDQRNLLNYSPTTRKLYGLAQYLSIAGL